MRLVIATILLLLSASELIAQKTVISRKEFEASYFAADERTKEFRRIHDSKEATRVGGNLRTISRRWTYGKAYTSSLKFEEKNRSDSIIFEMVNMHEDTYCRHGSGAWIKVDGGACNSRTSWMVTQFSHMMVAGASSVFTKESIVEAGEMATKYVETAKFEKRKTPSGTEIPASTYESVFVVDSKGRFLRIEYKRFVSASNETMSTWADTFTYDANLVVEAPIK